MLIPWSMRLAWHTTAFDSVPIPHHSSYRGLRMCRIFAIHANRRTRVATSLLQSPTSLVHQSVCDLRKECHDNGWGIGYHAHGLPERIRSARPADEDSRYRELAETVAATSLLAHIRKASAGSIAECNSHPFVHGRWLFAHNGTLYGFAEAPERLRRLLPEHLRKGIHGQTDSEHAFHLLLARLEERIDDRADVELDELAGALIETIHILVDLYPGNDSERSQMNFVVTDGRLLAASRCRDIGR